MTGPEIAQIVTSVATLIGVTSSVVINILSLCRIEAVHIATNSMKDELIISTAKQSRAEGILEGKAEERAFPGN